MFEKVNPAHPDDGDELTDIAVTLGEMLLKEKEKHKNEEAKGVVVIEPPKVFTKSETGRRKPGELLGYDDKNEIVWNEYGKAMTKEEIANREYERKQKNEKEKKITKISIPCLATLGEPEYPGEILLPDDRLTKLFGTASESAEKMNETMNKLQEVLKNMELNSNVGNENLAILIKSLTEKHKEEEKPKAAPDPINLELVSTIDGNEEDLKEQGFTVGHCEVDGIDVLVGVREKKEEPFWEDEDVDCNYPSEHKPHSLREISNIFEKVAEVNLGKQEEEATGMPEPDESCMRNQVEKVEDWCEDNGFDYFGFYPFDGCGDYVLYINLINKERTWRYPVGNWSFHKDEKASDYEHKACEIIEFCKGFSKCYSQMKEAK